MSLRLEGVNPVREFLRAGWKMKTIYTCRRDSDLETGEILALAAQNRIPVHRVTREELERMAPGGGHQGIVAEADSFRYVEPEDMVTAARQRQETPLVIVLDGIEDPHNLGAVIRTAECLGAHGVIVPEHRACQVTPAVIKASAGAAAHLPVARVNNLVTTIKRLKEQGLWITGLEAGSGTSCRKFEFPSDLALVVGGEGRGLRRLVRENCDFLVELPLCGQVNSLNASVALGIFLYEATKGRPEP